MLRELPPIPGAVSTRAGALVLDGAAIKRGLQAWQQIGGQELGSVWGHGAYVAPDARGGRAARSRPGRTAASNQR